MTTTNPAILSRREEYPKDTRVRLVNYGPCGCDDPTHNDNIHVTPGTQGTVTDVDDGGTIHVRWDNGRNLGLIPGLDTWEKV
jgi:hypothetical protein